MTTRYQEIARELRDGIENGTYAPGSKLPAIPELMRTYDVARDTVRDAIARLTHEGLVTPRRGVGTTVRDNTPVALGYRADQPAATWSAQAGEGPDSDRIESAGWETPDRGIIERLELPPNSQVVRRLRHQSKGEQVAQLMEQWLPDMVANIIEEHAGTDLADPDVVPSTDLYSLMRRAGESPSTVTERLSTRMPTPDEVELMELPAGVPVLVTYRVTRNDASIPLETATFVGAGDRMSQSFTVNLQ